jgi:hypothetical protein
MNEIRIGDHVYLKMDDLPMLELVLIDNEGQLVDGILIALDDNVIGMFGRVMVGLLLGKYIGSH